VEFPGSACVRGGEREDPRSEVKIVDAPVAGGLWPHVSLEVARVRSGHAWAARQEENAITCGGPAEPASVPGAHVRDHAVVDPEIESRGQTTWTFARQRHHPEPLQESRIQTVGRDEGNQVASRRPGRGAEVEGAAQALAIARQVGQVEVEL